jgi:patatin-like phospholipase/acyl hydrolase
MSRILSIDGGGIRGLIPALVLAHLERITATPAASLFDLIAGTSTGGILALGLAHGIPAARLVSLYETHGGAIFSRSLLRRLATLGGLREEKYSAGGLERLLQDYFGDHRLSSLRTNVLVTGYEIERRVPFFFRSARARTDPAYDFRLRDAARATSAAPTYFEPHQIPVAGSRDYWALVDGGVFANNPALCAYVETVAAAPPVNTCMLSLGTGTLTRRFPIAEARRWGLARWTKPLLDIVFDGVSSTVDYQLGTLLGPRYLRLQAQLQPGRESMDDTSPENLRWLRLTAEDLLRQHITQMETFAPRLLAPRGKEPLAA